MKIAVLQAQLEATRALLGEGELEAASRLASESLALARSAVLPAATSAWVGAAELVQAQVELAAGRPAEARRLASEASRELADTVAPTHPLAVEAAALASGAGLPDQGR